MLRIWLFSRLEGVIAGLSKAVISMYDLMFAKTACGIEFLLKLANEI